MSNFSAAEAHLVLTQQYSSAGGWGEVLPPEIACETNDCQEEFVECSRRRKRGMENRD